MRQIINFTRSTSERNEKFYILHWHIIDPACHFYFLVCFSNFHLLRILMQTNEIAIAIDETEEKEKQVMVTCTLYTHESRVTLPVWLYLYISIHRARYCVYSSSHSSRDLIFNVLSLLFCCSFHLHKMWTAINGNARQLSIIFPITWQWHWKNSRVDFDIPVISWWHH